MAGVPADRRPSLPERRESNFLFVLWGRKWLVLMVVVVAAGLGALYYLKTDRVYRSTAQVLLIKKEPGGAMMSQDNTGKRSNYGGYEDTLSTHMLLICSPAIVRKAVEKRDLRELPSLIGQPDAADAILGGLKATRPKDASQDPNVMELSYEGTNAEDCAKIVTAVIDAYQAFLGETYQNANEETLKLISQAKDVLHQQLMEKEAAYRKFRQDCPLLWKGEEAANLHEARMAEIEKARSQVLVERAQLESRIECIEKALQKNDRREAIRVLIAHVERQNDPSNRRYTLEEKIFDSLLEQQDILDQYGVDHPRAKSAQRRLDSLRDELAHTQLAANAGPKVDFLRTYVDSQREELKMVTDRLDRYNTLFEQERKSAKNLSTFQVQEETYRSEIARTQQMFQAVIKRLEEINLVKDYGGITAKTIWPASDGYLVRPKALFVFGMALMFGFMSGCALAQLGDAMDRRIRSPEDLQHQLGVSILGHVPRFLPHKVRRGEASPLSPMLCAFHEPRAHAAEAYRAIRNALYFHERSDALRVVQVTSPSPADGKTTVACNLAVSLADSGKRVILIDADFRRPMVHKYFGLENTIGLSSVLVGESGPAEVIHDSGVPNLSVVAAGKVPRNPADLFTLPTFREVLVQLCEQYDFIILDTPPLLPVTDPSMIAARADAVIMVVRLNESTRDAATRANEMLTFAGANVLGIVVNGLGAKTGYYGYKRYGYGHYYGGYRYGNGYGYGYGDGNHHGNGRPAVSPNSNGSQRHDGSVALADEERKEPDVP